MTGDRYETYQDEAGEWRWRLKDGNGKIVAESGEGYETRANVDRAIDNVIQENLKESENEH